MRGKSELNMNGKTFTLVLFCASALVSCGNRDELRSKIAADLGLNHEPSPVPVRVVAATESNNGNTCTYVGEVTASKSAVISAIYGGRIEDVLVTPGTGVTKGQVLARINSEQVSSAYEAAKATLAQAEDALERVGKVYGGGGVSEMKMVEIRTKVEQARASEKACREALENCTLKAPFNGTVGDVLVSAGEQVTIAAPVLRVTDASDVEVRFKVPESEYNSIKTGDRATVEVPALRRSFNARVSSKGVGASPVSHSYDFVLKGFPAGSGLAPGMVCKVSLSSGSLSAVVVPASAVMTDMEGRYVWGVDSLNTVTRNRIVVSGYSGTGIVVSEGLEAGDLVIVEGRRKVSTGMKVKVIE